MKLLSRSCFFLCNIFTLIIECCLILLCGNLRVLSLIILVISLTKSLIMTGFLYVYFSCNWHAITWMPNQETKLQLLILDTYTMCTYLHLLYGSFFLMFHMVLKLMESATEFFAQNKFLKDIFNLKVCY